MDILLSPSLEILAFVKTNYMTSGCQNDVFSHFKLNCSEKSNFGPFQLKEELFLVSKISFFAINSPIFYLAWSKVR